MRPVALVALLALTAWARAASAHGDVHARIDELTARLEARPDDARTWLERGSAHALDEDWANAALDFEQAVTLGPGDPDAARRLANARLQLGEPEVAAALMDPVLEANGRDAEAHLVRARARRQLGRLSDAADDYTLAIESYASPAPHLYLERADNEVERRRTTEAIEGLRAGIAALGPIVTLVERLADLHWRGGDPAGAARTLDELPYEVKRSPRTLLMKARYLREAGDERGAADALDRADEAIRGLPESRRESAAMRALSEQIRDERPDLAALPGAPVPARIPRLRAIAALAIGAVAIFAALGALARAPHSRRRLRRRAGAT